jgi:flagellar FliL protein
MADQPVAGVKKNKGSESESPKVKRGKKGLLLIGGLIVFILLAAGSIFLIFPSLLTSGINPIKKAETSKIEKPEPAKQGHIYSLDSLVVNLADTEFPRYLKIKIDIESEEPKANEEYAKRSPQLKDAILTILTSKTYPEISESKGKLKLKEEIVLKANQLFEKFKVKTIYFTEFVVQ